ncbi:MULTISPECIES: hypothetical protein [Candidatus Kuenenia]|nr:MULTISPECIES: hypothetical protein [Kuenenia]MCZ7623489.1 hypothetical protein [Candidatus Kuenenia sp.]
MTVVELLYQILPPLDKDMALLVQKHVRMMENLLREMAVVP